MKINKNLENFWEIPTKQKIPKRKAKKKTPTRIVKSMSRFYRHYTLEPELPKGEYYNFDELMKS